MSLLIPIFVRGGEGGGGLLNFRGGGGVVKKRESPDFRSPEVGISELVHPFFLCCIFLYCIWLLLHNIHKAINLKTKPDALSRLTQCAILLPLGS